MKKLLLTVAGIFLTFATMALAAKADYEFHPSKKGPQFKLFRHDIGNFKIDIPLNWTFGVTGKPPGQAIMMYPEGLDPTRSAPSYGSISVGVIPATDVTLEQAHETISRGMQQTRNSIKFNDDAAISMLNGNQTLRFSYTWISKTGFDVMEDIFLIKHKEMIYSIEVRKIAPVSRETQLIYDEIVNSFEPAIRGVL